jgi:hypothetical protein
MRHVLVQVQREASLCTLAIFYSQKDLNRTDSVDLQPVNFRTQTLPEIKPLISSIFLLLRSTYVTSGLGNAHLIKLYSKC